MPVTLDELARLVNGKLAGPGATVITGAATLRDAQPGDITLADRSELARQLAGSGATAAVVPVGLEPSGMPHIVVGDVHAAFARVVTFFRPPRAIPATGISPQAVVSPTARLGENVTVYPQAFIGDEVEIAAGCIIHSGVRILPGCRLAANVTLFPNVVLYENTVVGERVIVHASAVIGAYGFGYSTVGGRHQLSAQLGYVVLENDVDVGACTTIDRGTYGPTVVGEGTKIDNQVMIGHNCRLGKHNLICSQAGIAGSSLTGDYVVLAGQAGVADHVEIGDRAILGAKAGVHNHVPPGITVLGSPAAPIAEQRRMMAAYAKLPEMRQQVKQLQRQVDELLVRAGLPTKPENKSEAA